MEMSDLASCPEGANHRKNPSQFLLRLDRFGPGASGFAADIDDLGAFAPPCAARGHRCVGIEKIPRRRKTNPASH